VQDTQEFCIFGSTEQYKLYSIKYNTKRGKVSDMGADIPYTHTHTYSIYISIKPLKLATQKALK